MLLIDSCLAGDLAFYFQSTYGLPLCQIYILGGSIYCDRTH